MVSFLRFRSRELLYFFFIGVLLARMGWALKKNCGGEEVC